MTYSTQTEIENLQTNLNNAYTFCQEKGATIPTNRNFDNLATCIGTITGYENTGTITVDSTGSLPSITLKTTQTDITVGGILTRPLGYNQISEADFSSITSLSTNYALRQIFKAGEGLANTGVLKKIKFTNLQTVSGSYAFQEAFYNQALKKASFPALTTISGTKAFDGIFSNCFSIERVDFPVLNSINASNVFWYSFMYCKGTEIYFPALRTTSFGSYTNQFQYLLFGADSCIIHFHYSLEGQLDNFSGYSNGFNGNGTEILYDIDAGILNFLGLPSDRVSANGKDISKISNVKINGNNITSTDGISLTNINKTSKDTVTLKEVDLGGGDWVLEFRLKFSAFNQQIAIFGGDGDDTSCPYLKFQGYTYDTSPETIKMGTESWSNNRALSVELAPNVIHKFRWGYTVSTNTLYCSYYNTSNSTWTELSSCNVSQSYLPNMLKKHVLAIGRNGENPSISTDIPMDLTIYFNDLSLKINNQEVFTDLYPFTYANSTYGVGDIFYSAANSNQSVLIAGKASDVQEKTTTDINLSFSNPSTITLNLSTDMPSGYAYADNSNFIVNATHTANSTLQFQVCATAGAILNYVIPPTSTQGTTIGNITLTGSNQSVNVTVAPKPTGNFTIVGDPTIVNNVASGFSPDDYLETTVSDLPSSGVELIMHWDAVSSIVGSDGFAQPLMGDISSGSWCGMYYDDSVGYYGGSSGEYKDLTEVSGKAWYLIRKESSWSASIYYLQDDNDTYTLATLPDVSNWRSVTSIWDTEHLLVDGNYRIGMNPDDSYSDQYWRGSVYLEDMVIRNSSTGVVYWRAIDEQ